MKTYLEFLTELFDKPLPHKLIHSTERGEIYAFKTPNGQKFEVQVIVDQQDGTYEFIFGGSGEDTITKTGKGEEFRVFSTVLKIIKSVIDVGEPEHFFIQAVRKEPGRVSLFQKIIKKFLQLYPDYESKESIVGVSEKELEQEEKEKKKPEDRKGFVRWDIKVK